MDSDDYDFDMDEGDLEDGNDDDIGALGSILSWDDNEEEGQAINGYAAAINAALREREGGSGSGSSAPPDMVQFSTKDGVPQFNFLQSYQGMSGNSQHGSSHSGEGGNGNSGLTMQLPLPTPVSCLEHMDKQQQAQTCVSNSNVNTQQPLALSGTVQQQQGIQQFLQQNQQPQVQQNQQQQQQPPPLQPMASGQGQQPVTASGFAHLFSQQASNILQQQQNKQQAQPVNLRPDNGSQQYLQNQHAANQQQQSQQPQQAANPQTQQQQQPSQMQLPFTADPNTFLQQLQFAQLQHQLQAAQHQAQQQAPAPLRQQIQQMQLAQNQAQQNVRANIPLASAAPTLARKSTAPPPAKKAKTAANAKKKAAPKTSAKKGPPSSVPNSSDAATSTTVVSASDTDCEASKKGKDSKKADGTAKKPIKKEEYTDTSTMTADERAKANRDRNKEHARNTRLRKKAYLEKLKVTVDELCRERDTLVSERAGAATLLVEMHNTRIEVLMSFFALRSANEKRRMLWASILDESCFTCALPVTPYRSFPASEVQVSKCQRTIQGIDGVMADTASLHVLLDTLVDRARFPEGKIEFRYTLVTEEAVVAGNQVMARWVMTTTNAVQCGAKMEVSKQGMLCCKFNSTHKIVGLELMFDVMAFMLQLKQAAGIENFSVVPNTVQTCQRSFDKPMVMTLAEPPYTIMQVNKLWEEMTGYQAEDVVGKASCAVLQGQKTDKRALDLLMDEVRFKRPSSATVVNYKKSGEKFRNFLAVYPLSTDSRITHYLALSYHIDDGESIGIVPPLSAQSRPLLQGQMPKPQGVTSGSFGMPAAPQPGQNPLQAPPMMSPLLFNNFVAAGGAPPAGTPVAAPQQVVSAYSGPTGQMPPPSVPPQTPKQLSTNPSKRKHEDKDKNH